MDYFEIREILDTAIHSGRWEREGKLAVEWNKKTGVWYVFTLDGMHYTRHMETAVRWIRKAMQGDKGNTGK